MVFVLLGIIMFFKSSLSIKVVTAYFILFSNLAFAFLTDEEKEREKAKAELLETVTDGPYVFAQGKQLSSYWLCQGKVIEESINADVFPLSISRCNLPVKIHGLSSIEDKVLTFQGDSDVAALSDFHGQYDLMIKLLMNNNIIDENKQWAFADGHFVITGDIFDRGDKVTEILWFLYDLEKQAEKAGGKVHLTLGNHEVMVLNGDLRYLHPKYLAVADKLAKPFEQLFSKESILGNWLRSKPVLVKVNNMLFAHGGFHPSLAEEDRSIQDINRVFKNSLVKAELDKPRAGWAEYLHKSNGPIWYRGYFKDDGATSDEIDLLLRHFDVEHLIVGHTSQKQIETRYQGRVIAIDSSIKKGQYGEILFVSGSKATKQPVKMWRGSLSGKVLPLYR